MMPDFLSSLLYSLALWVEICAANPHIGQEKVEMGKLFLCEPQKMGFFNGSLPDFYHDGESGQACPLAPSFLAHILHLFMDDPML